jgi:predicted DCC family thiol-disulfide oxidoreductase YuxK
MTADPVTVYYDGACHLCSREIDHYRKVDRDGQLRLIDIADPAFHAEAVGLDAEQVQKVMHVRLADGTLATGLDAFIAIWKVLPGFGTMARMARMPLIHPLLRGGYRAFAAVRPYLPKRSRPDCVDGSCKI